MITLIQFPQRYNFIRKQFNSHILDAVIFAEWVLRILLTDQLTRLGLLIILSKEIRLSKGLRPGEEHDVLSLPAGFYFSGSEMDTQVEVFTREWILPEILHIPSIAHQ